MFQTYIRNFRFKRLSKLLHNFIKFSFSFLFIVLFFFIFSTSVSANTYYVAGDTGNDTTGNGSSGTPWKTIQKAANTMVAGDTVNVRGGLTYSETTTCLSEPSVVCPTNSGSAGNFITYQSWSNTGTPIIHIPLNGYGFRTQSKSYISIKGFDFRADEGSTDFQDGLYLINGSNITIINNIFRNFRGNEFTFPFYVNVGGQILIYNNTFENTSDGVNCANAFTPTISIKNNLFYNTTRQFIAPASADIDYNNWDITGSNSFSGILGAHNIVQDPLLTSPSEGNLTLQSNSPAKNAGVDLSSNGVTTDILSVARPQGSGYDIGAYEYYDIPVTLTTTPTSPSSNTTPTVAGIASTIGVATISSVTYSVDSGSWSSTGVTGTSSFTIVVPALADGSHTVRVRATDSYGNVSDSTLYGSTTFTVDTTSPSSNSISINSGATYSTSTGVTLTFSSTGASQMMISEDSGFSGASWETYSTSKSFTLSTGEGTKTVYAKFKDESGNTSSSVSDSIVLDTINPTLGSFVTPRDYTKDDNKPTLTFKKATDSTSGISSYSVSLDSGKNKNYSTSGIPSNGDTTKSSYVWKDDGNVKVEFFNETDSDSTNDEIRVYFKGLNSSELTEGKHIWKVTVADVAGNETSSTQDFYLDKTSPFISELAIANISTVKKGQTYELSIFKRIPSFSGKIEDPSLGSEKTNDDGSKDTFDKVSSGIDNINLVIKKFDGKKYANHFTKDYSVTSNRFYITTPYPLVDGQYEIIISTKDTAGNINGYPSFYLTIGNSSIFSFVTSFVNDLFGNKLNVKPNIKQTFSPTPTSKANTLKINNQNPLPKSKNIFSLIFNLITTIFHK